MILYNRYSEYLKQKYGVKVYKLPISIPVTCPNRDGTISTGGCSFCGPIGAGYENLPASMTVAMQIEANKAHIVPKYKAEKFIAYFQNYSNTYLPPKQLLEYLKEACQQDVVEISLATRPDCVNDVYLDMLYSIKEKFGVEISLELGLQSVNYHSLIKVNRGHTLGEYIDATLRIKKYGFLNCTHLILNLPWDDMNDVIENAKVMSALAVDQVKLHALYIVKETEMANWYKAGNIELITKEEYMERVIVFLEYLHPDIVVQRLLGRAPQANTLFSNWGTGWWKIRDTIETMMQERETYQGKKIDYLNGRAVKQFI